MLWAVIVLQWLHVLAAIFWFGLALTTDLVLPPMLKSIPIEAQKSWLQAFAARYGRVVGSVGGLAILSGILRGIVAGVLGALGSAYGLTWIVALVLSVGVTVVETRLIGPTAEKVSVAASREELSALLTRISGYGRIELGGFLVLFTLMIAMRFGY